MTNKIKNKDKCLNELCSLRTIDGLCSEVEPCIFQEARQRTMIADDTSYTVTGSIIDTSQTTDKESTEDKIDNAIDFSMMLVILSAAAAIGLATIYLLVKIIKEIIGV